MRVLHVVEVFTGGVISVLDAYARWQVAQGHDVHIMAPASVDLEIGTRHVWDPARRTPQRWPQAIKDLRRVVADLEPDVVHLHSFFPGVFGRLLAFPGAKRPSVVYQPHSWAFDIAPTPLGPPAVALWERYATRNTDVMVVNCDDEGAEGARHGISLPTHPVGVPLDIKHFAPISDIQRQSIRLNLGVADKKVLLCVGRLVRQKGQDRLVGAWRQSPIPGAVLVLLGAGDPEPLKKLAGPEWGTSIIAPGAATDVRPWLHASDLCVTPSRWEGQAVSVAESLACGRPVVSTRVNGAQEAIVDGPEPPAGVVIEQTDMAAFMVACRRRVTDPSILEREAAASRPRAIRMFDADDVVRRVDDAYREALQVRAQHADQGA